MERWCGGEARVVDCLGGFLEMYILIPREGNRDSGWGWRGCCFGCVPSFGAREVVPCRLEGICFFYEILM